MKLIYGAFMQDTDGTTYVFVYEENRVYIICKNGDWSYKTVGEMTANGGIFTQEMFDAMADDCIEEDEFELIEEEVD